MVLLFSAATHVHTQQSCLPSESDLCSFEPLSPVIDSAIDGTDYIVNITVINGMFDASIQVTFPDSDTDLVCDLDITSAAAAAADTHLYWSSINETSSMTCNTIYTLRVPTSTLLDKCGFSQRDVGNYVVFGQQVDIATNRSCTIDGRLDTQYQSRSTTFSLTLNTLDTVTAIASGLEVFGEIFALHLLGDITLTPDIDTGLAFVQGIFVTDSNHPYMLEFQDIDANSTVFNVSTFETTNETCTADNTFPHDACQQKWNFSMTTAMSCHDIDYAPINQAFINMTFNVACSLGFNGECAAEFQQGLGFVIYVTAPDHCLANDAVGLSGTVEPFGYSGSANSQNIDQEGNFQMSALNTAFGSPTLAAPSAVDDYVKTTAFVEDSVLYAEFEVSSAGSAVRLTSTGITRVTIKPLLAHENDKVVYDSAKGIYHERVSIYNDSFGTSVDSLYADTRARFALQWKVGDTVNLDPGVEEAQTINVEVVTVSSFINAASESDAANPIIRMLSNEQHVQSAETSAFVLFDENSGAKGTSASRATTITRRSSGSENAITKTSGDIVEAMGGTAAAAAAVCAAIAVMVAVAVTVNQRIKKKRDSLSVLKDESGEDYVIDDGPGDGSGLTSDHDTTTLHHLPVTSSHSCSRDDVVVVDLTEPTMLELASMPQGAAAAAAPQDNGIIEDDHDDVLTMNALLSVADSYASSYCDGVAAVAEPPAEMEPEYDIGAEALPYTL
jgi:hypothetical protein